MTDRFLATILIAVFSVPVVFGVYWVNTRVQILKSDRPRVMMIVGWLLLIVFIAVAAATFPGFPQSSR